MFANRNFIKNPFPENLICRRKIATLKYYPNLKINSTMVSETSSLLSQWSKFLWYLTNNISQNFFPFLITDDGTMFTSKEKKVFSKLFASHSTLYLTVRLPLSYIITIPNTLPVVKFRVKQIQKIFKSVISKVFWLE